MKIAQRQLEHRLRGGLAAAYLIAGDEPLLVDEAAVAVRDAAAADGYCERELYTVERGFSWATLGDRATNLSLFASRRIVELRMQAPRPGDDGARTLPALLSQPDPDRLLLLTITARLDAPAARSAWVRAFDQHGVIVEVWPIDRRDLPAWLTARAARVNLKLSGEAAESLADRVEGNLLAADQEIRKLALTVGAGEVGEQQVLDAVADSARFDVFRLTDALLAGEARRAVRVLRALRAEGAAPPLVSWALAREFVLLAKLKHGVDRGARIDDLWRELQVRGRRQSLLKRALTRYSRGDLAMLLAHAARTDSAVKGAVATDPWDALTGLVMAALEPRRGWGVPAV